MEHCDWLLSWIIFGRAPFVGKIRLGLRDYIYMSFCPIFLRRKENDLAVFSILLAHFHGSRNKVNGRVIT